ncbi:hypothetical protein HFP43_03260 [Streptomyces sp. SJ1-7]|nr:hypothetical protein [Streptomyces sp. SJ1-7]
MEIEDFCTGNSIDLLENRIATRVADGIGPQALTAARGAIAVGAEDPGDEIEVITSLGVLWCK